MAGFPPPVYSGLKFSDSEDIEAMETKTEGVVKELAGSSTGPDEIEVINEGLKKEECDATNIGELEEKMNALTQDEGDGKKSLLKLIQDCDKSDADWEVLIGLWNATVMICTELSKKLVDFLVSASGKHEKIQQFISLLESVDGYEKSLVIKRNVDTLEMVLDNLEQMKGESEGLKDESPVDDILKKFFDVILHLNSIMSHTGLPVLAALRGGELSKLEDGLKQCENEMEGISQKVNALKVTFSFTLRLEKNQFWLPLIEEMWKNMEFEVEVEGDSDGVKKLTKWLEACLQSDSESEGPNGLMDRLIKIVTELSKKLADFMVSLSRKEDKFQQFISRLRSYDGYKKSLVIRKIVHVLQMVEDKLGGLKFESLLIMEEEFDSSIKQNEDAEDESPTDYILKRFFDVILHLESIMSHPGLHESEELTGVELSLLEDGLKQCEDALEGISLKVNDLKVTFSYFQRLENNELWKTTLSIIEDVCNDMEFKEGSEDSEATSKSS
ncbi:hypothetical protein O6P43_032102 [Quillaja saponaria]|uniref:Uncharacterized protein n=1 Tax=Quillaja saponaria TaxID=32244 RepID=A0AAD7KWD0_QUISA|nr:hypothetical protein O6P43_032102 [Quillaja saponaria]